jgi:hypothetical protein
MTGHKNGKISNRELDSKVLDKVKYLIDVDFDGGSNGAIGSSVSLLSVEK